MIAAPVVMVLQVGQRSHVRAWDFVSLGQRSVVVICVMGPRNNAVIIGGSLEMIASPA